MKLLLILICISGLSHAASKPNVIYIIADDLGYGDLSAYGQTHFTTPNIDAIAKKGMLFKQHYSAAPVCAPARGALMTGYHVGHGAVRGNFEMKPEGQQPMPAETFTLAHLFKKAGYATGAFGKWGLGAPGSASEPLKMGFDRFYGYNCQRQAHHYYPYFLWNDTQREMLWGNFGMETQEYAPDLIQEQALKFVEANKDRPFFLFYPLIQPHAEMIAPEKTMAKYRGKFLPESAFKGVDDGSEFRKNEYASQPEAHAAFAAMGDHMDEDIGELMAKLDELGIADNTLVIFTSDNGPHREGGHDPDYFKSSGSLRGYKRDLYEGGIRVPMIAAWPGKIPAGTVTDHVSAFQDVLPTMADLTGQPTSKDIDGISFLPTLLRRDIQRQHDYEICSIDIPGVDGNALLRRGRSVEIENSMKNRLTLISFVCLIAQSATAQSSDKISVSDGWVTVTPSEFHDAINNPLKGFRDYKKDGYGLLKRTYIKWSDIEFSADDSVERIIAHTRKITEIKGKRFEDLNIKLVPRVYLDWNGTAGKQYWPTDLHAFDYDSPAFQQRLERLVAKLGEAWDDDPRIFAVQMGLIGHFGEHHNPAPTADQRRLLTEAFQKAFKNKPVLVRHNDAEFMEAGFGIYYDTFANLSREPPAGPKDQFPWQATHVYRDIWKRAPIEGEVEYNWQQQRENAKPNETFGRSPDETMTVPAYRRYMIDKIRRYHTSYLGWINNYDASNREVLAGAAEIQKTFGYRFVLDSASYPIAVKPGEKLSVKLAVRNTGSAPFYLDWPVAVGLLDPVTKKPVWSTPLAGVDIRKWLPGEDWDSEKFAYGRPAVSYRNEGHSTLPADLTPGKYIIALAILDRQGGMMPSARFAIENYFRGGWHPLGFIGIGKTLGEPAMKNVKFDSPTFDDSLHYKVPERLLVVKAPPMPHVNAVTPWTSDPNIELINPWRYWILKTTGNGLEKKTLTDYPGAIRVTGDFGDGSSLNYNFGKGADLEPARYRFAFRVRGTPDQSVEFELADGWRGGSQKTKVPLTEQWQEHTIKFEIKTTFKDEATLRFRLPRVVKGTFDLANTQLKVVK